MRGADQGAWLRKRQTSCPHALGSGLLPGDRHLYFTVFTRDIILVSFICVLMALIMVSFTGLAQAQTPTQAIGQVETLKGNATAIRTNNTVLDLSVGDPIFKGDTVQTGPSSTLGITFLDQTVFSLAANARMVINDLVYNPQRSDNNMAIDLVQGTFIFLAGRIAPSGDMIIDTPVAQIGIRGTLPWITVGDETSFAILTERDGTTGEYFLLQRTTGNVIGTVNLSTVGTTQKLVMNSPTDVPRTVDKTPEELAAEQRFRDEIFETVTQRDTRLGIAPDQGGDQNRGPTPGDQGGNPDGGNPSPGDQGSLPDTGPADAAAAAAAAVLVDQANAVVAVCSQAQVKINRALQFYYQGDHTQSRQLLQDASDDIDRLPPQSCGTLLERIAGGQQAIGQVEEDERNARSAINRCDENEINRLRGRFASSRQSGARVILARLDAAARKCANRRIQKDRAQEKSQAWAQCRRQYGNRLVDVKFYRSGRYRCIVDQGQPQPTEQAEQRHDPATSAAVIGGVLGVIQGLGNRREERPSNHN